MKTDKTKSILFMLISSFGFALMQILVKLSGQRIPTFEQVFFRNLVTLFLCAYLCYRNNANFFGTKKSRPFLILRSLFGYLGVVFNFIAIRHMMIADSTILQRSSPLFVTLFAVLFLKEKLTKKNILTLALCFIGVFLVVNPAFNSDVHYALLGLLSAAFAGAAYTSVSYLNKMEDPNTIVFFFSLFSVIVSIPLMWSGFIVPTAVDLFYLLMIGVSAGIGQIFMTLGYRFAPASEVSIYNYSTVVFATVLGYFVFGDVLTWNTALGILLIFGSSYSSYRLAMQK